MFKRWILFALLSLCTILLANCNRPQISGDASIPDLDLFVPCDFEALFDALHDENQPEITLSPGCIYNITSEHAYLIESEAMYSCLVGLFTGSKVIHGNGATLSWSFVEVNGNDMRWHPFHVRQGEALIMDNLRIENVDTVGAWAPSRGESCLNGGVIYNEGTVEISDCVFVGNRASSGGVISATSTSTLHIANSIFENNHSNYSGGAITTSSFDATISNSQFRNNQALKSGGALFNSGELTILDSRIENNIAGARGGGIYHSHLGEAGYTGNVLRIVNTSMNHNWAPADGGGIENASSLDLQNSTISTNHGGGIHNNGQLATISGSYLTIASNVSGSGIRSSNDQVHFENTIVSHNSPEDCDVIGSDPGVSSNISSDGSCPGFSIHADPLLGPLASNGGSTLTHGLPGESPAVDAATGDCPGSDQRGVLRPEGDACDLGAYEYGILSLGGLPPFLPELAEAAPDIQEFSADALLPEGEPSKPSHTGRIEEAIPCFNGPGPMYAVVSSLQPGALVEIIGISENGDYIVILNPCYAGVPCWAEEGSIEIHDQLDPSRVIPDPALPEEEEQESSGNGGLVCTDKLNQQECNAAGGNWSIQTFPGKCICP